MPNTEKHGWEGQVFIGTVGSTAATLLEIVQDCSETREYDFGDTTTRGDSSVVPRETQHAVCRKFSFQFTTIHDNADANLETLRAAQGNGTAIALRTKDEVSGKGFDGDVYLTLNNQFPLRGAQAFQFTATPTKGYGRNWTPYT